MFLSTTYQQLASVYRCTTALPCCACCALRECLFVLLICWSGSTARFFLDQRLYGLTSLKILSLYLLFLMVDLLDFSNNNNNSD
jgi:hypothetical protein